MTRERIRQIEAKALAKMRHPSTPGGLRGWRSPDLRLISGRLHLLPELTGVCLDGQSGLGSTWTTPGPASVVGLAIPEDDTAPDPHS